MNPISNPYAQTLTQKGYSLAEIRQAKQPARTFPCEIAGRYFATECEYKEALHDFLNGY